MTYFIQTTIYAALLYLVYLLLLRNKASHNWSRAYLLMNMLLPFVLPLIKIEALENSKNALATVALPVINIGTDISARASTMSILPVIYGAICFTLFGYLTAQVVQLVRFIRRHQPEQQGDIKLVRATGMGPGSWFNYVFIPAAEAEQAVLDHESAHVKYGHSYDIVLSRLALCFAWPNVMLWVILKELKTVHEFQADAAAGIDKEYYGQSLLNELFHTKHFALSHTFFHHPIKRRIIMLEQKNHTGKLKVVALSLLMVTGMLFVQCAKDGEEKTQTVSNATTEKVTGPEGIKEFDQAPEFDGDLMTFMGKNIVYPKDAQDRKVEGKVIVKLGISENGELETVDVVKSPDESLTKAALEVINKMPKWKPAMKDGKPVKAQLFLPIAYKLQ